MPEDGLKTGETPYTRWTETAGAFARMPQPSCPAPASPASTSAVALPARRPGSAVDADAPGHRVGPSGSCGGDT